MEGGEHDRSRQGGGETQFVVVVVESIMGNLLIVMRG